MLPVAQQLYRVTFVSTKGTLEVVNTFHVAASPVGTNDPPTPAVLANEISGQLSAIYREMLTPSYTLDRIDAITVTDPNDPTQVPVGGTKSVQGAGARAVGDEDLPPRIGGLISWRSAFVGKSFRGRTFLPPVEKRVALSNDLIADGDGYSTAARGFANKIMDANLASGSGWASVWTDTWHGKFVIYSPTRHKHGTAPWWVDITGYRYDRKLAYLRSRDS